MVGLKQEFRQSQSLVMTQALQQSIKLLQLSAVELQEFIDAEIEKNPLLSREESDGNAAESTDDAASAESAESTGEGDADVVELRVSDDDFSVSSSLEDESYANDYSDSDGINRVTASSYESTGSGGAFGEASDGPDIEGAASHDKTLREFLLEQIHMDITDPVQALIAEKLVDLLDDAGYLREDTKALAETLGATRQEIDAVIARLQQFEPVGVFARSLTECLRLQLADMNRLDPVMEILLDNLEMMGRGEIAALRKKCHADDEDFAEMLADIRRCNPKPGNGFAREDSQAVIPDVVVRRGRGNDISAHWLIELNPDALPRVLINRQYTAEVNARPGDKEAKKFVSEQMANANWLIKALDSRAQTILKVTQEIVKQQEMFLLHGIRFLKPLVLKDIALAVGMHESTISRVTTAKYMATPRGTLELKFFFNASINAAGGQNDFSSKTVQYYIKDIVEAEDPKKILSDDAIVTLLKDKNIDVARRTVTKYREEMNIPSSVVRRRLKQGK
jgi:RNA polymerase sigma-54 factor